MVWVSYFWQLPGGSPLEGFVMFLMKTILKRRTRDLRASALVKNKDFLSDKLSIYFLVQ